MQLSKRHTELVVKLHLAEAAEAREDYKLSQGLKWLDTGKQSLESIQQEVASLK